MATASATRYHHGDLRRELMEAAVDTVASTGAATLSLRGLAAAAGVSHAAPVHHFGDKAGLFTAVATEGFDLLADELVAVWEESGDFLEVGVRYVHFALSHPGHFEVMFRPGLCNADDPGLQRSKMRAFAMLHDPLAAMLASPDDRELEAATLASWSIVHGLATLVLSGNLPQVDLGRPDELARHVIAHCRMPDSAQLGRQPRSRGGAR